MTGKTYEVLWVNTWKGGMHRQTYRIVNVSGSLAAEVLALVERRNHLAPGVAQVLEVMEVRA